MTQLTFLNDALELTCPGGILEARANARAPQFRKSHLAIGNCT